MIKCIFEDIIKLFIVWFIVFKFAGLGQPFWNDLRRYEGEFKDDKIHGQGKKEVFIWFVDYTFSETSIGKFFWSNGRRHQGKVKNGSLPLLFFKLYYPQPNIDWSKCYFLWLNLIDIKKLRRYFHLVVLLLLI